MLIIFGGLPGTGKTAIAKELARQIGAVHVRIDSIEQAIRNSGDASQPLEDVGYRVAYAVAEDNLRLGHTVVADSVNPLPITRDSWLEVARQANARAIEVEITCSDVDEHRRRVLSRVTDIAGLRLPTWAEVISREYHPWNREHLTIDTARSSVEESVRTIQKFLRQTACDPNHMLK